MYPPGKGPEKDGDRNGPFVYDQLEPNRRLTNKIVYWFRVAMGIIRSSTPKHKSGRARSPVSPAGVMKFAPSHYYYSGTAAKSHTCNSNKLLRRVSVCRYNN